MENITLKKDAPSPTATSDMSVMDAEQTTLNSSVQQRVNKWKQGNDIEQQGSGKHPTHMRFIFGQHDVG